MTVAHAPFVQHVTYSPIHNTTVRGFILKLVNLLPLVWLIKSVTPPLHGLLTPLELAGPIPSSWQDPFPPPAPPYWDCMLSSSVWNTILAHLTQNFQFLFVYLFVYFRYCTVVIKMAARKWSSLTAASTTLCTQVRSMRYVATEIVSKCGSQN